jgi:hypothetical protein
MAKKQAKVVTADEKIAFLKAHRSKFSNASEANKLLQSKFGSGLIYGVISKALGLAPTTPRLLNKGKKKKAKQAKKRGPGRPKGSGKKRGPGRPKGTGKKRGPGRPKGSGKKRGPGRPRKSSVSSSTPEFVVVTPGRGRGWNISAFSTRDDAMGAANEALAKGTPADRVGIYTAISFSVKTAPTVSF